MALLVSSSGTHVSRRCSVYDVCLGRPQVVGRLGDGMLDPRQHSAVLRGTQTHTTATDAHKTLRIN